MTRRTTTVLAWSLFGVFVVSAVATLALVAASGWTSDEAFVVLVLGFAVVGALVAVREPANAIGWLLLGFAVSSGLQSMADVYIRVAGRPGEIAVAWYSAWAWNVWLVLAALILPLVFPDGRLLSRRWRPVVWIAVGSVVLSAAGSGLVRGPLDVDAPRPIDNPVGVTGPLPALASGASNVFFAIGLALAVASLVLRFRRSQGRERLQLKLFAYVGALATGGFTLAVVAVFAGESSPSWVYVMGSVGWIGGLLLVVLGVPVAVGVAILRHRLYDIDVVINRTLVYGALTATLVGFYLGSVLTFRLALSPLTGESQLAVAGSTLAVAAAFRPVRSRIQGAVDRRFYRARYDVARTLESFSGRLRDELDLEALGVDLRRVVRDTMAPTHVSLWLREAPR